MAWIKYGYILLPLSEWSRFRVRSLILRLLSPWIGASAGYRFWSEQIRLSRSIPPADRLLSPPVQQDSRPRLLLVDSCTPTPDRDSGSMDIFNSIKVFIALGFRVSFIPESNLLYLGRYTEALKQLGVECIHGPQVRSISGWLKGQGDDFDVVMLCRAPVAIRLSAAVRRHCPSAQLVFSTIDLQFLRESRRLQRMVGVDSGEGILEKSEIREIKNADLSIVISEAEREILSQRLPGANVALVPLVRDFGPFEATPFASRHGLAFIGNYQHPPNVDAVLYFLDQIWPKIASELNDAEFHVVGSYVPSSIEERKSDRVKVHGFIEDLDAFLAKVRLTVAPLRFGAGLKGKVASSLAQGVPGVLTSIAAEGMGLQNGQDVLIADDPHAFADEVIRLYQDPLLWEAIAASGAKSVRKNFSLKVSQDAYAALLRGLGVLPTDSHSLH